MKLKDKVAIVTGAGSGIGKGIAMLFAKQGAKVVVADLNFKNAQKTAKQIGRGAVAVEADVSNSWDVDTLIQVTAGKFKRIDILVNNAGVYIGKPLLETSEDDWDKVMDVNLKGAFLCSKAVIPYMLKRKKGKIINIASIAGEVGFANSSAYCASKGGLRLLTKEMALEFASQKINVNAIGPGVIKTAMTKDFLSDKKMNQALAAMTPYGRFGEPVDIANAALFLASDDSDFVNGITLFSDGGWLTH